MMGSMHTQAQGIAVVTRLEAFSARSPLPVHPRPKMPAREYSRVLKLLQSV